MPEHEPDWTPDKERESDPTGALREHNKLLAEILKQSAEEKRERAAQKANLEKRTAELRACSSPVPQAPMPAFVGIARPAVTFEEELARAKRCWEAVKTGLPDAPPDVKAFVFRNLLCRLDDWPSSPLPPPVAGGGGGSKT